MTIPTAIAMMMITTMTAEEIPMIRGIFVVVMGGLVTAVVAVVVM